MPADDAPTDRARRDGAPWGRRPVAGIPVPPFTDPGQGRVFRQALAEHLALTAVDGGSINPAAFALVTALSDIRDVGGDATDLEPWVLRVAMSTYFPAPWRPQQLVAAIRTSGVVPGVEWYAGREELGYHSDPDFHAARDLDGRWVAVFRERGVERVDAELADDDDMVLYVMAHLRGNPYPFGWKPVDPARLDALSASAGPTLTAWNQHAAQPYLASWGRESPGG